MKFYHLFNLESSLSMVTVHVCENGSHVQFSLTELFVIKAQKTTCIKGPNWAPSEMVILCKRSV